MELKQLIKAIRALQDEGTRLGAIEKEVGVPRNTLSGMLNGTKPFKDKWKRKLTVYIEGLQKKSKPRKVLEKIPAPPAQPAKPAKIEKAPEKPPIPAVNTGLTKAQQLRRYREQSQTLD